MKKGQPFAAALAMIAALAKGALPGSLPEYRSGGGMGEASTLGSKGPTIQPTGAFVGVKNVNAPVVFAK